MGCLDIILIKCLKGLKSQKSLFETKLSTVTESAARPPTHPRRVLIRAAGASKKKSDSDKLITILMTSFPCCSLYFKVSLPYVIIWLIFWQLCCLWCQCQLNRTYSFHCLCLVLDTLTLDTTLSSIRVLRLILAFKMGAELVAHANILVRQCNAMQVLDDFSCFSQSLHPARGGQVQPARGGQVQPARGGQVQRQPSCEEWVGEADCW